MGFITVPSISGTDGIVDSLKSVVEKVRPLYDKYRPLVSSLAKNVKGGQEEQPGPSPGVEAPPPQEPDPSSRGGFSMSDIPTWAIYAGGAAIAIFFFIRSKK